MTDCCISDWMDPGAPWSGLGEPTDTDYRQNHGVRTSAVWWQGTHIWWVLGLICSVLCTWCCCVLFLGASTNSSKWIYAVYSPISFRVHWCWSSHVMNWFSSQDTLRLISEWASTVAGRILEFKYLRHYTHDKDTGQSFSSSLRGTWWNRWQPKLWAKRGKFSSVDDSWNREGK